MWSKEPRLPLLKKNMIMLCYCFKDCWEEEWFKISCMKERKRDSLWLKNSSLWLRLKICKKMSSRKFWWMPIMTEYKMHSLKHYKVMWFLTRWMLWQRNWFVSSKKEKLWKWSRSLKLIVSSEKLKNRVKDRLKKP